jgi:hypothetical protein
MCINKGLKETTSCLSSHIGKYVDFFDLPEKIPKVECKHELKTLFKYNIIHMHGLQGNYGLDWF